MPPRQHIPLNIQHERRLINKRRNDLIKILIKHQKSVHELNLYVNHQHIAELTTERERHHQIIIQDIKELQRLLKKLYHSIRNSDRRRKLHKKTEELSTDINKETQRLRHWIERNKRFCSVWHSESGSCVVCKPL